MIIVFGGAFNPPTQAHQAIYHTLQENYQPQRFVFLPVGDVYHKADLAPCHHRLAMLKLLFEKEKNVDVMSLECELDEFKGTFHSLNTIAKKYQEDIVYVIGADHLEGLKHWLNANQLIEKYRFIVLNRGRKPLKAWFDEDPWLAKYHDRFLLEEAVDFPIAATDYRTHRHHGVVPKVIEEYIHTHQLYMKEVR